MKYIEAFKDSGVVVLHNQDVNTVRHHFVISVDNRDQFRSKLEKQGIGTDVHYPNTAADEYHQITNTNPSSTYKNASYLSRRIVSLPLSQWMSDTDVEFVISAVSSIEK
jgi:dTDP-4-amino-4,6-dideoxygalactose transaminase